MFADFKAFDSFIKSSEFLAGVTRFFKVGAGFSLRLVQPKDCACPGFIMHYARHSGLHLAGISFFKNIY